MTAHAFTITTGRRFCNLLHRSGDGKFANTSAGHYVRIAFRLGANGNSYIVDTSDDILQPFAQLNCRKCRQLVSNIHLSQPESL